MSAVVRSRKQDKWCYCVSKLYFIIVILLWKMLVNIIRLKHLYKCITTGLLQDIFHHDCISYHVT